MALIRTNHQTVIQQLDDGEVIGSTNQSLCLPKSELNTKNSTKQQQSCRLVKILVFKLGLRQTQALISTTNNFTIIQPLENGLVIRTNEYLYLPKPDLNNKKSTK